MLPERVWLPPNIVIPPAVLVLLMMPDRVPEAALIVSNLVPKAVAPVPLKVLIPLLIEVIGLISKVPSLLTPLELAMLPEPDSVRVVPVPMVVAPV